MANNMESLLMGGSDDDSDSDTNNIDLKEGSTVAAAVRVQVASPPIAAPPVVVPPAVAAPLIVAPSAVDTSNNRSQPTSSGAPTTTFGNGSASQQQQQSGTPSDLSMRLKSLYSPAAKQPQASWQGHQSSQQSAPAAAAPPQQQQQRMPSGLSMQPQPLQHQRIPPPSQQQPSAPTMANQQHTSTRQQNNSDPFAPTPVSEIMQKAHNYNAQHHLGQPNSHSNTTSSRSLTSTSQQLSAPSVIGAGTTASSYNTQKELELKRQKQRFVLFTQNLIKILKAQDPALHERVGAVIKDCTARNKRQEPGYESVTVSMQRHLREIVNDNYWKQAQHATAASFVKAREKQQQQQQQQQLAPPSARTSLTSTTASTNSSQPMSVSQQQLMSRTAPQLSSDERAAHERRQKETFQLFLKILIKILKDKDPPMFNRVNTIMIECAERNKRHEPGYESVTTSVKTRLKAVVSNNYIEEAKRLTARYQAQQRSQQQQQLQPVPTQMAQTQAPHRQGMAPPTTIQTPSQNPIPNQTAKGKRPSLSSTTTNTTKAASAKATASTAGKPVAKAAAKRPKSTPPVRKPSMTGASTEKPKATPTTIQTVNSVEPQPIPAQARDYNEFMEMVHHAVNFDWTTAGLALGAESLTQLPQEQQDLLMNTPPITAPLASAFPSSGWGERNVVSVRTAWARVHMREDTTSKYTDLSAITTTDMATTAVWENEASAELQDSVLAALSEGAQQYLTSVLQKAVLCARQRHNVDGIRLWHQQLTAADEKEANPLSLRLGCDVSRQWAQEQGNAAMTVKRMEEALERQSGVPGYERELTTETMLNSANMAELSLRPALSFKAVETADYHAKRSFEIYGGKDAAEPPLGRVPKRGKIEVNDFLVAQHLGTPHHRHQAAMISHATAFF